MRIRKEYIRDYDEWKKQLKRDERRNIMIVAGAWLLSACIVLWLFAR